MNAPVSTLPPLRTGYTTGLCATACTQAAMLAWLRQSPLTTVAVSFPDGERVELALAQCTVSAEGAVCSVRKDAGDDPDDTHGAEVGCRVTWRAETGVVFRRGEGVGLVTLPGLPVPVGEPAINPVPRRMMTAVVNKTLSEHGRTGGAEIEVFVRGGAEIATRTLNPRLGVVGGISIIGTTGRVRPFSSEAYIAAIGSALAVANASGCQHVVLNSGGRSESMLRAQYPELPAQAFIQYGNWIGDTFMHLRTTSIHSTTLGLMLGKAVKLAAGQLNTHSRRGTWDPAFVAELARECGYEESLVARIAGLNLARQLGELIPFNAGEPLYQAICASCLAVCRPLAPKITLEIRLHNEGAGWLVHTAGRTLALNFPQATLLC